MSDNRDVVWRGPPPIAHRRNGKWTRWVPTLRDAPGKWAQVLEEATPGAAMSAVTSLRRLGCEVTQRRADDGSVDVYARWPEDAS